MISGNNFVAPDRKTRYSYYFSRLSHTWGWATWRSTWELFDRNLTYWETVKRDSIIREIFRRKSDATHWTKTFQAMHEANGNDIWDIQFAYSILTNNMLCIVPEVNLVQNIGFGPGATHTTEGSAPKAVAKANEIMFPLRHPPYMVPMRTFEEIEHQITNEHKTHQKVKRRLQTWYHRMNLKYPLRGSSAR